MCSARRPFPPTIARLPSPVCDSEHMKLRPVRAAALLLLLAGGACSSAPEQDYVGKISAQRADKDQMFRSSSDSPIVSTDRDRLLPLTYFPIDETYAVPAQLEPATARVTVTMPTSTGKLRQMERVGELRFTLKGQPTKLAAFVDAGTTRIDRLFVPFTDLTSGAETYPAGRYMDLDPTASGIYIVDFNVAYHPYCYYNAEYDCPYPPSDSRLQMPVRAGERLPRAEGSIP